MRFERGKTPMEGMKIGKKANAIEIIGAAEIHMELDGGPDAIYVHYSPNYRRVEGESHVIRVILGVISGELRPDEHALEVYDGDNLPSLPDWYPDWRKMDDLLGEFVKYKGEIYKIPTFKEYVQIRKKWQSARSNGIGNLRLH